MIARTMFLASAWLLLEPAVHGLPFGWRVGLGVSLLVMLGPVWVVESFLNSLQRR